jgi:hypothetical protein
MAYFYNYLLFFAMGFRDHLLFLKLVGHLGLKIYEPKTSKAHIIVCIQAARIETINIKIRTDFVT